MEIILCGSLMGAVLFFFYLLNTARKKTPAPTAGKKDFTQVYLSIADDPDAVIQGMDRFVAEVQQTESAGDRWRWVPMLIFSVGLGLMVVDGILLLTGYTSLMFTAGRIVLWIAALVMAHTLRKTDSHDFSPRYSGTRQNYRHTKLGRAAVPGGVLLWRPAPRKCSEPICYCTLNSTPAVSTSFRYKSTRY